MCSRYMATGVFFFISSHTFVRIYIGARFWKSDRVRVIKGSASHYARNPLLVIVRVRVFDRLRVSDKTYRNEHLPDWGREGEEGRKGRNYRIRCALQMREYTVYTGRRERWLGTVQRGAFPIFVSTVAEDGRNAFGQTHYELCQTPNLQSQVWAVSLTFFTKLYAVLSILCCHAKVYNFVQLWWNLWC